MTYWQSSKVGWLLNRRNAATLQIRFIFVIVNLLPDFQYQLQSRRQRKCSRYYYSDKISLNYHFISLMISSTIDSLQLSWIWGKVGYYYNKIQHTTIINYYYDCPPAFFSFWLTCFLTSATFDTEVIMSNIKLLGFVQPWCLTVHSCEMSSWLLFPLATKECNNNCVDRNKTLTVRSHIWPQQHQT